VDPAVPTREHVVTGGAKRDPNDLLERRAVISGAAQSDIGRRLYRDPLELTLDACLAAIADAGLTTRDIDGIATYPGPMSVPPGFSGGGVVDVQDALRLELGWWAGGIEFPGQLGTLINACFAVAAGLATHVLCFRSVWEGSAQGDQGRASVTMGGGGGGSGFRADGFMEWTLPFAAPSAANWIAMMAQRHFYEYGTTREQLAQIALNARKNAALNPKAIYRDPMTMDDYLGIRMITTPLCLYDCDVPCDGATAVIVSRADTAPDLRKPPLHVEAVGTALRGRPSWDQFDDLTTMACRDAAAQMWTRTDLKPSDVQLAEMYDGFSFITIAWLEAMGFCGKGEAGPFIEGGAAIARDGVIPLNTHGGQLSAGRLHGYGFLHEACVQLWGEAGERQVPGDPEVGVAAAGGGPLAGALLLTRHR
jgi:acetyl-CoA acetyltransferase